MKRIFRALAKPFSANNLNTIVRGFKEQPPSNALQKASIYIQIILATWALLITIKSEENEQKIKDLDKVINALIEQSLLQREEIAQLSVIARNSDMQQEKTDEQIQSLQTQTKLQARQVDLITSNDKREQASDFFALHGLFNELSSITSGKSPSDFYGIDEWGKIRLLEEIFTPLKREERNGFVVKNREFAQEWRKMQSLFETSIKNLNITLENGEFDGNSKMANAKNEKLFEDTFRQTIDSYYVFYSKFSKFLKNNESILQ